MNHTKTIRVLYQKIPADLITPVQLFLTLRDMFAGTVLLESTDFHRTDNHFSFLAFQPISSIRLSGDTLTLTYLKNRQKITVHKGTGDFIPHVEQFLQQFTILNEIPDLLYPPFIGYMQYDAIEYDENIVFHSKSEINLNAPVLQFQLYRCYFIFDHYYNDLYFLYLQDKDESAPEIQSLLNKIIARTSAAYHQPIPFQIRGKERQWISDVDFEKMVQKAKYHVHRGDVFQIVLSNRFSQAFTGDDFQVYRMLRRINPSPYLFYFDLGNFRIFGSSPESQIRIRNGEVILHPIAGTYKRTGDPQKDQERAQQLLEDRKEAAEHVMLVDLARNDLSKHGRNVRVETFREIQYFSHVIHLVSEVKAQLEPTASSIKVIMDTFPAGTLTGAPKFKAMELIDAFESLRREFYGGAVGFLKMNGDANLAIFIRSVFSYGNTLHFQAGAGVVADSEPEKERQEVYNKSHAIRQAIHQAHNQAESPESLKIREQLSDAD
jgi:anthranilate synthase component 1